MSCDNPEAPGNNDFMIATFERKWFVEGHHVLNSWNGPTQSVKIIARICLLDVEDDKIKGVYTGYRHSCGRWV